MVVDEARSLWAPWVPVQGPALSTSLEQIRPLRKTPVSDTAHNSNLWISYLHCVFVCKMWNWNAYYSCVLLDYMAISCNTFHYWGCFKCSWVYIICLSMVIVMIIVLALMTYCACSNHFWFLLSACTLRTRYVNQQHTFDSCFQVPVGVLLLL